jgi:hypothetical protein
MYELKYYALAYPEDVHPNRSVTLHYFVFESRQRMVEEVVAAAFPDAPRPPGRRLRQYRLRQAFARISPFHDDHWLIESIPRLSTPLSYKLERIARLNPADRLQALLVGFPPESDQTLAESIQRRQQWNQERNNRARAFAVTTAAGLLLLELVVFPKPPAPPATIRAGLYGLVTGIAYFAHRWSYNYRPFW